MSIPSRTEGDVYINGNVAAKSMSIPAGTLTNAGIAPNAAIDPLKLRHQHRIRYSQPNTAATSETRAVYECYGATATIVAFRPASIAPAVGDSTVTVNLLLNGVSALTGVVTLDSTNTARTAELATLATTAMVQGDVLEIVTVATAGTGTLPTGLFANITVHEDAQ